MISHDYKCIFIHIPKVAGQSIEHFFLDMVGLDWNSRSPLLIRKNNQPSVGPKTLSHMKAFEYVKYHYISQDLFDGYFKFGFVRNPWSRIVSIYKFLGYNSIISFKTFISYQLPKLMQTKNWFICPQYEFLYHEDKLIVDFVGKFEHLDNDFKIVCGKLGIDECKLSHINKSKKQHFKGIKLLAKDRQLITKFSFKRPYLHHYQEYYTQDLRDKVYSIYKKDVDFFEYNF